MKRCEGETKTMAEVRFEREKLCVCKRERERVH